MPPKRRRDKDKDSLAPADGWLDPDERERQHQRLHGQAIDEPTDLDPMRAMAILLNHRFATYENANLSEFKSLLDGGDLEGALTWLQKNVIDYDQLRKDELKERLTDIFNNALLQKDTGYAKTTFSMTDFSAETQQAIEKVLATAEPAPEHPAPGTITELAVIRAEAGHLEAVVSELRERKIPLSATEVEIAVGGLHNIANRADSTARQLGLHAVERGLITQTALAQLLGVNNATISRWYRQNQNKHKAQEDQ